MIELIIVGAGGAGRELANNLYYDHRYKVLGFVDDTKEQFTDIDCLKVLGDLDWLRNLRQIHSGQITNAMENPNAVVCIVNKPRLREVLINSLYFYVHFPTIIDQNSLVSRLAELGEGVIVAQPYNHICPGVKIGKFAWINSFVGMGHECEIGEYTTMFTNIQMGGESKIGKYCVIGSGVTIKPGVVIGDDVTVGGGSVVVKDVPNGITVVGNPARELVRK